jgi:hypothetical protein
VWPASAADAPLWAGPVYVQPTAGSAAPAGSPAASSAGPAISVSPPDYGRRQDAAERAALLAYLIRRYFSDLGWPR